MSQGRSIVAFVWNNFQNDARVLRECRAWAEAGYAVTLVALLDPERPALPPRQERDGFTVLRVDRHTGPTRWLRRIGGRSPVGKLGTLLGYGIGMIRMMRAGRRLRADLYHANDLNTLPQAAFCAKWFRRRRRQVPLVYDSHEVQTSRTGYGRTVFLLERWLNRYVDAFLCENEMRAEYTATLYGMAPPVPIHNYPEFRSIESIRAERADLHGLLGLPGDEPILLYQGGLQAGRGLEQLLEATPSFRRGTVVLLGDGRLKPHLLSRTAELGLSDRVRFVDRVPVETLLAYTANAYLGFQVLNNICFNHYSALSNKLFEYMMCGVPVIACDFPGIARVIEDSGAGILVDSHSPASIAAGVNRLLDDPALRDDMSRRALAAIPRYTWEVDRPVFLRVYESLLEAGTPASAPSERMES